MEVSLGVICQDVYNLKMVQQKKKKILEREKEKANMTKSVLQSRGQALGAESANLNHSSAPH